jgi:hypothetical protein
MMSLSAIQYSKYSFYVSYLISLTVIHIHVFVLTADNYTAVYTGVGGFLVTALVAGFVFAKAHHFLTRQSHFNK